jgi:hypothetical protein
MFDLNLQAHLILLIDRGRSKLKPDHSSLADEFRPTRWSVVLLSAQSEARDHEPRSLPCAGSTGIRFMRLFGGEDTILRTRKI